MYVASSKDEQMAAAALLATHNLDFESHEDYGSQWSIKWSKLLGKGEGQKRRALYQWCVHCIQLSEIIYMNITRASDCGFDHNVVGTTKRQTAFSFTGCLAHVEVTYLTHSHKVLRVRGLFMHNQGCKDALITRFPPIPLHPSVLQIALTDLKAGMTLADLRDKNKAMVKKRLYPEQPADLAASVYRWIIRSSDSRSLYRQFNRVDGIKVTEKAHMNIHEWLDPESAQYNATLCEAIFYYTARSSSEERFQACVSIPEMREAAWKYGHASQIILDGTFGVCDKRVLLFIVMGIDEHRKGVPLAFFFFSAPSGNRHTAASYNMEILGHLLQEWKTSMGTRNGISFEPLVAITDTDIKERGALVLIFPRIWLLICKFHICQSWRNHRNKVLKGKSPTHVDVKNRLRRVEE
jgi:hypothetical protein